MSKFRWNVHKAFEKYRSGLSLKTLAKKYGVHYVTVRIAFKKIFGKEYLEIAKRRKPKKVLSNKEIKKLFQQYKKGKSVYRLSKEYGVNDEILYRHFQKIPEYAKISRKRRMNRRISQKVIFKAFQSYKKRASSDSLAKKYNISRGALIRHFKKFWKEEYEKLSKEHRLKASLVNVKSAIKKNQIVDERMIKKMISMRKTYKSVYEIAESLNITPSTVTLYLKKYDNFIPFDRAKYILSKGMSGEKIVEEFLRFLSIKYESQKILTNGNKPDFVLNGNYFVEVKSKFLTYEDFCKIKDKYLTAKELTGGVIISFYGYSRKVLKAAKNANIIVLNGEDIKMFFDEIGRNDLARTTESFINLNYGEWKKTSLVHEPLLFDFIGRKALSSEERC